MSALAGVFPAIHVASNREVAARCSLIILCLGASDAASVLAEVDAELSRAQLLQTTAAAIPLKMLEDRVPCRVGKLISSITQEIGAGISLLMYGTRVTPEDRRMLEALLGSISQPVVISESQARPAIGIASGGPALLAYVLQCMADEAVRINPDTEWQRVEFATDEFLSEYYRLQNSFVAALRQEAPASAAVSKVRVKAVPIRPNESTPARLRGQRRR